MNLPESLLDRMNEIINVLKDLDYVLAVIGLGSTGNNQKRLDKYSDLDFFIIVEQNKKEYLLTNLYWLESVQKLKYIFRNTIDGYKALFNDNIFIEFSIFSIKEFTNISYKDAKILWQNSSIKNQIPIENKKHELNTNIEWITGELITNLYIGLMRFFRGEKLSAYKFVNSYAIDRLVELIRVKDPRKSQEELDTFALERRFEFDYPEYSVVFKSLLLSYDETPKACKDILQLVKTLV